MAIRNAQVMVHSPVFSIKRSLQDERVGGAAGKGPRVERRRLERGPRPVGAHGLPLKYLLGSRFVCLEHPATYTDGSAASQTPETGL